MTRLASKPATRPTMSQVTMSMLPEGATDVPRACEKLRAVVVGVGGQNALRLVQLGTCTDSPVQQDEHDERCRPEHRGNQPHRAHVRGIVTAEHQNTRSKPPSNAVPCAPMIGAASATNWSNAA